MDLKTTKINMAWNLVQDLLLTFYVNRFHTQNINVRRIYKTVNSYALNSLTWKIHYIMYKSDPALNKCRYKRFTINILFYSYRLQLASSWKKKKTMKTFFHTTHSELMRKKMVTKYSHIIPRPKTIRRCRERENQRKGKWWMPRVRYSDMYDILKVRVSIQYYTSKKM